MVKKYTLSKDVVKNINHAEQIILRNILDDTKVTRKGISWGSKQRNTPCSRCKPSVDGAGWYDFSQINIGISQKAIEDINWDDDDPLNDMVETQGTIELLASIRNMLLGIQQKSSDSYYFAACAENVINWKDALANFPYSKDGKIEEENLKCEYEIQLLFLDDLSNNLITLQDFKKYR